MDGPGHALMMQELTLSIELHILKILGFTFLSCLHCKEILGLTLKSEEFSEKLLQHLMSAETMESILHSY